MEALDSPQYEVLILNDVTVNTNREYRASAKSNARLEILSITLILRRLESCP